VAKNATITIQLVTYIGTENYKTNKQINNNNSSKEDMKREKANQ
jgi:hypothetical protein